MLGLFSCRLGEIEKVMDFPLWRDPTFLTVFLLASVMGSIVNYSIFLCTAVNSALTTAVIGCAKNVFTTYLGMLFLPGYAFSIPNFVGLNISIVGSIIYSVAELRDKAAQALGAQKVSGPGKRSSYLSINAPL